MERPRCSIGSIFTHIIGATAARAAAPRPCNSLAMISTCSDGARPHTSEVIVNTAKPKMKTWRM